MIKIIIIAISVIFVAIISWLLISAYFCIDNFLIPGACIDRQILRPFSSDKVRVASPLQNAVIQSPLVIAGEARGSWFFEASFPIRLVDANGKEIAVTHAQATKDWMTNDFVPFEATLRFETPVASSANLVFEKDNPSGLPENADKVGFPVYFEKKEKITFDSGLTGKVLLGPTCPVERIPPDPACAPAPYPTLIEIFKKDNPEKPYMTIKTDNQAYFRAELEAGTYIFQPTSDNRYPFCKPQEEEVLAHQFRDITLACDSGIR